MLRDRPGKPALIVLAACLLLQCGEERETGANETMWVVDTSELNRAVAVAEGSAGAKTEPRAQGAGLRSDRLALQPKSTVQQQAHSQAGAIQDIIDRFPNAVMLGASEFRSTVVGRVFNYRGLSSGIVVVRPGEFFQEDGRYSQGHRPIHHGTYSIDGAIVSIDCPRSFLNLGGRRLFFFHEGRLLTAGMASGGDVYELIPAVE